MHSCISTSGSSWVSDGFWACDMFPRPSFRPSSCKGAGSCGGALGGARSRCSITIMPARSDVPTMGKSACPVGWADREGARGCLGEDRDGPRRALLPSCCLLLLPFVTEVHGSLHLPILSVSHLQGLSSTELFIVGQPSTTSPPFFSLSASNATPHRSLSSHGFWPSEVQTTFSSGSLQHPGQSLLRTH